MVSYLKTQWFRLAMAVACFIPIILICCTSTATTETVEGLTIVVKDVLHCGCWFLASCFMLVVSMVDHNSDCIKKLHRRVEKLESRVADLENRSITDIDEVGPNHFVARRRLGPDK